MSGPFRFDVRVFAAAPAAVAALLCALGLAPRSAQARDVLPLMPSPEWCTDGVPTPVATFSISPQVLIAIRDADVCPPGEPILKEGECGQFDDDYSIGEKSAQLNCAQYALRPIHGSDIGSVIAVATHPTEFLDPLHRDRYRVEMGIAGMCLRCEPRPVTPVPPALPPR